MKVLLIEDNVYLQRTFSRMIRVFYGASSHVQIVDSADGAIQAILDSVIDHQFDVVISDYNLVGAKTGADVLNWIKEHTPHLERRFLFLSGNPDVKKLHPHWIEKPCDTAQLRAAISAVLSA